MTDSKISIDEVADIIDMEGIGYAVQSYMSGDSIEDPVLADLWNLAADALDAIERYIEAHESTADEREKRDEEDYIVD